MNRSKLGIYDELIETFYGDFNVFLELSYEPAGGLQWEVVTVFYEGTVVPAQQNVIDYAIEQAEEKYYDQ
jgi:hypothetical protein